MLIVSCDRPALSKLLASLTRSSLLFSLNTNLKPQARNANKMVPSVVLISLAILENGLLVLASRRKMSTARVAILGNPHQLAS